MNSRSPINKSIAIIILPLLIKKSIIFVTILHLFIDKFFMEDMIIATGNIKLILLLDHTRTVRNIAFLVD